VRLFLAVDPGDECRRRLAPVLEQVRASARAVRWVHDANIHVTLAFPGEVGEERVPGLLDAARQLTTRHAPFSAAVTGGGAFPDWRRPRVVWLGVRDAGALQRLGEDAGRMCASLGFPPDHPFSAHLTIGRVKHPMPAHQRESLRTALSSLAESYPFHVERVVLMRSALSSAGSVYSEVASLPLVGA
jgi:2'-5' RNA ligase